MPQTHVVAQGECLSSLAQRYGFTSGRDLYEHPDNASLRSRRPNPNVLHPGDRVVIPDREARSEPIATGSMHVFRVKALQTLVRLRFVDGESRPYAGKPFTAHVGGQVVEGSTDGDGRIELPVPADAQEATIDLVVQDSPRETREWHIDIGHLDPVEEPSGVAARLENLGILVTNDEAGVRKALKAFQRAHGLPVTGQADDATRAKLLDEHGD